MRPHNLPLVLLGAGLLWFGWFGFNAGSALAVTGTATVAMINTQISTAVAAMAWVIVEVKRDGKPTTLGVASGAIAGAVGITPACGYVSPLGAMLIGLLAGALCAMAVGLKYKFGYDDSLDVVGVHGVGGIVGMISIGLLATNSVNDSITNGLFNGGGFDLMTRQLLAIGITAAYAFVVTFVIAKVIDKFIGLRVDSETEITGVDTILHAESAYDFTGVAGAGHLGRS
jgi:Amt family ammonium transporter